MSDAAHLVLEDGTTFAGRAFGAEAEATGEVVFTTAMTGYQEALTDPSFAGQILTMTYPLQGNYGVSDFNTESSRIQARGFVVREWCELPSHWRSTGTLNDYLVSEDIPAIEGIDTRALTRKIRSGGVLMGTITRGDPEAALARLNEAERYDASDWVAKVSTSKQFSWTVPDVARHNIAVLDLGVKHNILRILRTLGCKTTIVPSTTSAEDILALEPHGLVISPGPGDPALLDYAVATAKELVGKMPIFGICLGHQVLARLWGARSYKLKFGHRGANHPVREESTGRVTITAQNHGYTIDPDRLSSDLEVSHVHLNDGTCEGLRHRSLPIFTIQYHSEASPGPHDDRDLFERFVGLVEEARKP